MKKALRTDLASTCVWEAQLVHNRHSPPWIVTTCGAHAFAIAMEFECTACRSSLCRWPDVHKK